MNENSFTMKNLFDEADKWVKMTTNGSTKEQLAMQCRVLDIMLVQKFIDQGYYTKDAELSEAALTRAKSDIPMETIYEKLEKAKAESIATAPWQSLDDWLGNAEKIMNGYLEQYPVGYLDDIYMDSSGLVCVNIACAMGDNHDGKWPKQKQRLEDVGLTLKERTFSSRYCMEATGNNVEKLTALFKQHQSVDISIDMRYGEIDAITLEMSAEAIGAYRPDTCSCTEDSAITPKPVLEYNEEDITKEINSFWFALVCLNEKDIDKFLACQNLELSLALLARELNIETQIGAIVDKRYAAERAAAKEYSELIENIGNTFNPMAARDVVIRTVRDMEYYLHKNIGLDVKEIRFYPAHYGYAGVKLKYVVPQAYRKRRTSPRPQDDTTQWDIHPETQQLLDTEKNCNQILEFCEAHNINILRMQTAYNTVAKTFIIQTLDVQICDLSKLLNSN